jgi:hypothetical protein
MRYLGIMVVCLILVLAAGCTTTGNPDEQFKAAWQNSENEVKEYGHQMRVAMGPEGSTDYDLKAISEGSRAMIGTIDRNYETIAGIPVSSRYTEAKQEYLAALDDLRTACIGLSQAQDAGSSPGGAARINASEPFLVSSQQKRHRVSGLME